MKNIIFLLKFYMNSKNSQFFRKESKEEKLKILSSLPPPTHNIEEEEEGSNEELIELIKKTKESNYSFIKELEKIKEFNNPENLNVRINI